MSSYFCVKLRDIVTTFMEFQFHGGRWRLKLLDILIQIKNNSIGMQEKGRLIHTSSSKNLWFLFLLLFVVNQFIIVILWILMARCNSSRLTSNIYRKKWD